MAANRKIQYSQHIREVIRKRRTTRKLRQRIRNPANKMTFNQLSKQTTTVR